MLFLLPNQHCQNTERLAETSVTACLFIRPHWIKHDLPVQSGPAWSLMYIAKKLSRSFSVRFSLNMFWIFQSSFVWSGLIVSMVTTDCEGLTDLILVMCAMTSFVYVSE